MRFTIVVAKHDTEPNAARYDDFVKALGDALIALGHEVTGLDQPGRLIMFNANNMTDPTGELPEDAILYNTEQIAAVGTPKFAMMAYKAHQKRVIWEYSDANVKVLRGALGMQRIVMCPVGYISSMTHITPVLEEDIDVLFYGALNARRMEVLDALKVAGLKVKLLYGVYGAARDAWIARSKIVLNLHFGFEHGSVFEIFRVSHLLANKRCVVSEAGGGVDEKLEDFARRATSYVPRTEIVERCVTLASGWQKIRHVCAEQGFKEFKKTNLVDNVRYALEHS